MLNNKFKIGDYIRIKEELKGLSWYSDEIYQIIKFEYGGDIIILDRELPLGDYGITQHKVHIENVEIDNRYNRKMKLKQICGHKK